MVNFATVPQGEKDELGLSSRCFTYSLVHIFFNRVAIQSAVCHVFKASQAARGVGQSGDIVRANHTVERGVAPGLSSLTKPFRPQ